MYRSPTYTVEGNRVTLELTRDDFQSLLLALGIAAGAVSRDGMGPRFWGLIRLVNEVNNGNPGFVPYEIPEEYRDL